MTQVHTTICRFYHVFCGIKVTAGNRNVAEVVGDKGRQLLQRYGYADWVMHPWKRMGGHIRESLCIKPLMKLPPRSPIPINIKYADQSIAVA